MAERSTIYLSHSSTGWHWSVISCVILLNWARFSWGNSCSYSQLTGWVQAVWSQVTSLICLAAVWLSAWKMEIVGSPPSYHSPRQPRLVHMMASGFTEYKEGQVPKYNLFKVSTCVLFYYCSVAKNHFCKTFYKSLLCQLSLLLLETQCI